MSARALRVARGFLAAGLATFVAALFHVVGGGQAPSALALTLTLTFSALACVALAGRRMALWRLALSVGVSQFLFHSLFTLSAGSGSFTGTGHHVHLGARLVFIPSGAEPMTGMLLGADAMWLSHAAAALLTIALLHGGERTARTVLALASLTLRRLFGAVLDPIAPGVPRTLTAVSVAWPLSLRLVLGPVRHRGPPVVVRTRVP